MNLPSLLLIGAALAGVLPLVLPGRRKGVWLASLSGLLLALWAGLSLAGVAPAISVPLPSPLPAFTLAAHGVAGLFLVAFGLFVPAALWPSQGRVAPVATGLLVPSVLLVLGGQGPFPLLIGWEALGALSYLLVAASRPSRRVLHGARILLIVSELGAFLLYAAVMVGGAASAADLARFHPPATPSVALWVSLLAIFAFGSKAGLFPLQIWIPLAEPEAPGAVAGLLSGPLSMVSLGALIQVLLWVEPTSPIPGIVLLVLGLLGAFMGALRAMLDADAKRVLAFGTVETMGLSFAALGLGLLLRTQGASGPATVAVAASVYLALQHAGSKLALFVAAGALEEGGPGRHLDRMGGVGRRAPGLSALSLVACLGLSGVPPLGGFVAEWLLLETFLMPVPGHPFTHAALGILGAITAVVAAMALTGYLRWFGIAFLGPARSEGAQKMTEPFRPIRWAMGWAVSTQIILGIGAAWFLPWIQALAGPLGEGPPLVLPLFGNPSLNPTLTGVGATVGRYLPGATGVVVTPDNTFSILSPWDMAIAFALIGGIVALVVRLSSRPVRIVRPWAGGDPQVLSRYAFTAEGLTHPLRLSFSTLLGLRRHVREEGATPGGSRVNYRIRLDTRLFRLLYRPVAKGSRALASAAWSLQSGQTGSYVLYVLIALGVTLIAFTFHP